MTTKTNYPDDLGPAPAKVQEAFVQLYVNHLTGVGSGDREVLIDAARQLEAAARRLRSIPVGAITAATKERMSEAQALVNAAQARMHLPYPIGLYDLAAGLPWSTDDLGPAPTKAQRAYTALHVNEAKRVLAKAEIKSRADSVIKGAIDSVKRNRTCGRCGGVKPVGESCGCFDNGGQ